MVMGRGVEQDCDGRVCNGVWSRTEGCRFPSAGVFACGFDDSVVNQHLASRAKRKRVRVGRKAMTQADCRLHGMDHVAGF